MPAPASDASRTATAATSSSVFGRLMADSSVYRATISSNVMPIAAAVAGPLLLMMSVMSLNRGDVDDAPILLRHHVAQGGSGAPEGGVQVPLHYQVPVLVVEIDERGEPLGTAGVVDHDVDAPEVLHGRLDGLFDTFLGLGVTLWEARAVLAEFAHHLLAAVGVAAADDDPRALR